MNIIFLDIDGVLNNDYARMKTKFNGKYDPRCIELICKLLKDINGKVVITSRARLDKSFEEFNKEFVADGCKCIMEYIHEDWSTDCVPAFTRGVEIEKWLAKHAGDYCKYLIIDDDVDLLSGQPQIRIDSSFGFTPLDYFLAKRYFLGTDSTSRNIVIEQRLLEHRSICALHNERFIKNFIRE